MPVTVIPSRRNAQLWGSLAKHLPKLEAVAISIAGLTLPLMTAFVVQFLDVQAMPNYMDVMTPTPDDPSYVKYPGQASSGFILVRLLGCILPVLLVLLTATVQLFLTFSHGVLHPAVCLITSIVLMSLSILATILTAHDVTTPKGPLGNDLGVHLGLTVSTGIIAALCTILITILYFAYMIFSAVALHRLRTRGLSKAYPVSEYGSEYHYESSFPGSTAGSTRRLKLSHTPTRPGFSPTTSVFSSVMNSPSSRLEEGRKSSVPSVPALPKPSAIPPPLPVKSPVRSRSYQVKRGLTAKTMKSTRSAPLAGPKSPRSPLSPQNSTIARQSLKHTSSITATADLGPSFANHRRESSIKRVQSLRESQSSAEQESPVEGVIERQRQNSVASQKRQRGLSLEGKAKRELQRMKMERLDVERAEAYRTGVYAINRAKGQQ